MLLQNFETLNGSLEYFDHFTQRYQLDVCKPHSVAVSKYLQFNVPRQFTNIGDDNLIDRYDEVFVGGPPLANFYVFMKLLLADEQFFPDLLFLLGLVEILDVLLGGGLFVEKKFRSRSGRGIWMSEWL